MLKSRYNSIILPDSQIWQAVKYKHKITHMARFQIRHIIHPFKQSTVHIGNLYIFKHVKHVISHLTDYVYNSNHQIVLTFLKIIST